MEKYELYENHKLSTLIKVTHIQYILYNNSMYLIYFMFKLITIK